MEIVGSAAPGDASPEASRIRRRIDPLVVAAVLLALCGLVHLRTCAKLVRVDRDDIGGEEFNVVYSFERLLRDGVLYTDPARPPFAVTQYSPCYYLACRAVASIVGSRPDDALGIMRIMRSVSFACLILQGMAVAFILRRHFAAPLSALVIAFVSVLIIQTPWAVAVRPDSMETLLIGVSALLGLESFARRDRGGSIAWLAAGLFCGTAAILTKQSAFSAGVILLPAALATLGFRRVLYACLVAGVPSAILAGSVLLTLGPAVKQNLIDGVNNGISLAAALHATYIPYFSTNAAPVAAALLASTAFLLRRRRTVGTPASGLISWAVLCSLGLALGLGLKEGSAINYFLTSNLFVIVIVLVYVLRSPAADTSDWRPLLALYLLLALPTKSYLDLNTYATEMRPYRDCEEVTRRLRLELDRAPGTALFFSQDQRLDCLIPDRAVVPQKLVASYLYRRKVFDFSGFSDTVRAGAVRYCVTFGDEPDDLVGSFRRFNASKGLSPDPLRPTFLGASFEGYHLLFRVGPHAVFVAEGEPAGS
jgi:hypothetical protein